MGTVSFTSESKVADKDPEDKKPNGVQDTGQKAVVAV